jgi:formylmethanofuran dehydrogenase subunit A
MFGPACTITADGALEYMLHASAGGGGRWVNIDIELETGCGIVPFQYRDTAAVNALQWVVGLELFLLSPDPWRVVLSTDHPNGATFQSYPELIHLLMDRAYRDERLKAINQKYLAGSALADGIAREYTLSEIAIITRAGPARILGLTDKGHLGPGADADVTAYMPDANRTRMFATPRYVVKGGVLVVEEGQLRRAPIGRRHSLRPGYDPMIERDLKSYFDRYGTIAFEHYAVD